jgi:2-keto-4-pentenoate hydratase/2-oxohepta-3-ene-1,7-dioic acid hydratase in catechol pathway
MRLVTFQHQGRRRAGLLHGAQIEPFATDAEIEALGALPVIERLAAGAPPPRREPSIALAAVVLEAPIPRPRRNIFCVGKNYFEHAHEFAKSGFDSSAASGAVPRRRSSSPRCRNA